jgi:hypothetical protein
MSAVKRPQAAREDELLTRAKRGRPFKADAAKRQDELLDHTLEQFMAVAYRAATMDGIFASTSGTLRWNLHLRWFSTACFDAYAGEG